MPRLNQIVSIAPRPSPTLPLPGIWARFEARTGYIDEQSEVISPRQLGRFTIRPMDVRAGGRVIDQAGKSWTIQAVRPADDRLESYTVLDCETY